MQLRIPEEKESTRKFRDRGSLCFMPVGMPVLQGHLGSAESWSGTLIKEIVGICGPFALVLECPEP